MVEFLLPKQTGRVRFPYPAPRKKPLLSTKAREVSCIIVRITVLWYDQFDKLEFMEEIHEG